MQIYLAASPNKLDMALKYTKYIAHAAYAIDHDGYLTRQNMPIRIHGGLMVIENTGCTVIHDANRLCRDIWRECGNRGFRGVVADFEEPLTEDYVLMLKELAKILTRNGRLLLVPESCGHDVPDSVVLICTSISGGTLTSRLDDAKKEYGVRRIALDLERLQMDFPLPCPSGEGVQLSRDALHSLIEREQPAIFFSRELGARYFTYSAKGHHHFVLFDDANSLSEKARMGHRLGIDLGLFMLPEVEDILPKLYPGRISG